MAATSVNSGKKLAYCEGTLEVMQGFISETSVQADEIQAVSNSARTASVDRVYNVIANMAGDNNATAVKTAEGIQKFLEELKTRTEIGQALTEGARKLIPLSDAIIAGKRDFIPVTDAVIESRGLDDNFTPAIMTRLDDALEKFILIRRKMIDEIADLTEHQNDEDTNEIYQKFGIALEDFSNRQVDQYAQLRAALEAVGSHLSKSIASVIEASESLKTKLQDTKAPADIRGSIEEV